ncbi:hypothetical protein WOLCODRAFT_163544 [Wolfiporia cocos MD-104 SS10]|uniref:Uncharacterized protein n=1 Tax=Wolfiporia cocos (strain MD-104) TaxID=742152 RepID=A0A2H3JTB0_WOLCO|nr:hypothetical protein WOLCODRAFT_163544 [Wolfiporia cocos MD-104 SS10]
MSTTVVNNTLCDFCQQKPKFGGHPYCGKTCAAQAAAIQTDLCIHCKQRPKFAGHDYCGKKCAAQAQAQKKPLATSTNQAGPGGTVVPSRQQSAAAAAPPAPPPASAPPTKGLQSTVSQLRQSAISQIAKIQPSAGSQQATVSQKAKVAAGAAPAPPSNGPNVQSQQPLGAFPATAPQPPPSAANQPPSLCKIPGCTEYVHVNPDGSQTSEYCSRRHRQEAVASGLAEACIMCREMPQSTVDYFCSRACREASMGK